MKEEVLLHKYYIRTTTKLEIYLKSSKIYVSNTGAAEKWAVTQLLIKHNGLISLTRYSQSELVTPTGCQWTNKHLQWKKNLILCVNGLPLCEMMETELVFGLDCISFFLPAAWCQKFDNQQKQPD